MKWHPSVKARIKRLAEVFCKKILEKAKYLNIRLGAVKPSNFGKKTSIQTEKSGEILFGCKYKRLNKGVLLPNGSVSICCNDYGLKNILGNLNCDHLNCIYNKIEQNPNSNKQFSKGKFLGCIGYEHYRDINEKPSNNRTI
jgi:hypothetical protein